LVGLVAFVVNEPEKTSPTTREGIVSTFLISQLPDYLFIYTPRICNFILLLIVWMRFSNMLPYVKFAEDSVISVKNTKATLSLTLILTLFPEHIDQIIGVVLSNGILLSIKSGSIKERAHAIDNYILQCAGSAHA